MGKYTDEITTRLKKQLSKLHQDKLKCPDKCQIKPMLQHVSIVVVMELYQYNMLENKNNMGNILMNILHPMNCYQTF